MSKTLFEEIQNWNGKRITYSNIMKAPWGHTSGCLILLMFDDGSRVILNSTLYENSIWSFKDLSAEEMKKHPEFFTPDDIADNVRALEVRHREEAAKGKENRRQEFERLQREFGSVDSTPK